MNRLRLGLSALAVAGILATAGCVTSSPHLGGNYHSAQPSSDSAAPSASSSIPASPSDAPSTPATSPSASVGPAATTTCAWGPPNNAGSATASGTPPKGASTVGTATILIVTNLGSITIAVDRAVTPCTIASFAYLASGHFFDESSCQRLTTAGAFLLQCGDPTGTGTGGPSYTIPDEALPPAGSPVASVNYPRGVVAMANYGRANTGGSQFFLVYKDSPLPDAYTKFGTITSGIEILDAVALEGVDPASPNGPNDGVPKLPVKILSLTLIAS